MGKFLKYSVAIILIVFILIFIALRIPSVQDRLLNIGLANLINAESPLTQEDALSAIVCGSRSPLPNPDRAETCILVKAGERVFIVDTGDGSASNLRTFGIPFEFEAILITHLHSDHISDLQDFHLGSWVTGRKSKLKVYGPEGIKTVTNGFEQAYSLDAKYRYEHHGDEVLVEKAFGYEAITLLENPEPFYNENELKITAFLVEHEPVEPALGFRFDYKGRSLVISGDTIYSDNLVKFAKDTDVLFLESLSMDIIGRLQKAQKEIGNDRNAKIMFDIQDYHISPTDGARLAKEANAGHLVFYHLAPAPVIDLMATVFTRGVDEIFSEWTLSDDGTQIILPINSEEILISTIN
jgi:ribonuclease Z